MPILVIPTRHERRAALQALPGAVSVSDQPVSTWQVGGLRLLESGMGLERVRALLPHLEALAPEAVWLFGWCGGLSADLDVSDLVADLAALVSTPEVDVTHIVTALDADFVARCRALRPTARSPPPTLTPAWRGP